MARILSAAEFTNIKHAAYEAAAPAKPGELRLQEPWLISRDALQPKADTPAVQIHPSGKVRVGRHGRADPCTLAEEEVFATWADFEAAYADLKPADVVPGSFYALPPEAVPTPMLSPELAQKVWANRRRASKPHSPTFVHKGVAVIVHRDADDGSITLLQLDGKKETFESWLQFATIYAAACGFVIDPS